MIKVKIISIDDLECNYLYNGFNENTNTYNKFVVLTYTMNLIKTKTIKRLLFFNKKINIDYAEVKKLEYIILDDNDDVISGSEWVPTHFIR